jgi:predicted nuclease of predicted toxin-antitoxin system
VTGFLFDQNLPQRVSIKSSLPIEHVSSLGSQPSDTEIWNYAKAHDLVIVTKDTDFADRVQSTNPPPRVVHLVLETNAAVIFSRCSRVHGRWSSI